MLFGLWKRDPFPTLVFVTHAKAGSTWIDGILRTLFGARVAPRAYGAPDCRGARGKVFTVFMTREQLLAEPALAEAKHFVVLRDLRDTLVSRYFSLLKSHAEDPGGFIQAERAVLRGLDAENGLLRVLADAGMAETAAIHRSWRASGEPVLHYEALMADDLALFRQLFLETLRLPVTEAELERAVVANRFETIYGRAPGEEDSSSHGRKGTPGDWRNHFTPRLQEEFHRRFGDLVPAA